MRAKPAVNTYFRCEYISHNRQKNGTLYAIARLTINQVRSILFSWSKTCTSTSAINNIATRVIEPGIIDVTFGACPCSR